MIDLLKMMIYLLKIDDLLIGKWIYGDFSVRYVK